MDSVEISSEQATLNHLTQFETYEDYLDSRVSSTDRRYIQSSHVAHKVVELGYRGHVMKRKEFESKRRAQLEKGAAKLNISQQIPTSSRDAEPSSLLKEICRREEDIASQKLATIIYIRCINQRNQEISGHIDLSHRLENEAFSKYFSVENKFVPNIKDLSYYNWHTQTSASSPSSNFQIIQDNIEGLRFKCNADSAVISVDPSKHPGENTARREVQCSGYDQITFFDHIIQSKNHNLIQAETS